MGDVINTAKNGIRLEQVRLNMPEARFYFSGGTPSWEPGTQELRAFIGEEELTQVSLERFADTGEGICYYVLLDVSASITEAEFGGIKEALAEFAGGLSGQDHLVFITFGEQVQTVLEEDGAALKQEQVQNTILSLENTDQKTLLFEAIDQMASMADAEPAMENMRRAALVITDGEDIATGKATRKEAEETLKESGIPVYGFTVSGAGKEATDAFGELARSSGGTLTILETGQETEGFENVKEELLNSWEAVFAADSNRVTNGMVNVSLEFPDTGEKKQTEAMQNRWQADVEAPVILEAVQEGEKQLRVTFSEAVTGAGAAEHYELAPIIQATEAQTVGTEKIPPQEELLPVYASAQEEGMEAVLTFDELPAGEYELRCVGLHDVSMEQNAMDCSIEVRIEGTNAPERQEEGRASGLSLPVLIVCSLFFVLAAAFAAFQIRKGKRSRSAAAGTEEMRDKAGAEPERDEAGNIAVGLRPNLRIKVEQRAFEERVVYFQARDQKEEVRVVIQKSMIVGRSAACELSFDDPALSRQHFALELEGGELWIRNLSQSGFTLLNGVKLQEKAVRLRSGDWISAGQLQLRIRF